MNLKINKKEIEETINELLFLVENTEEEESDWVWEVFLLKKTNEELYIHFCENLSKWYFYLIYFEKIEDYEFCQKIQKLIDFFFKNFEKCLVLKNGKITKEDKEYIELIKNTYILKYRKL